MFNNIQTRTLLFDNYHRARNYFIQYPDQLIEIERYTTEIVNQCITDNYAELEHDYNEASYLNPFWANYPPDDRGRAPVGDQIPWIEVGEHCVGHKLTRLLSYHYTLAEVGLPSGADNRFVIRDKNIANITNGFTDSAFIFLDIKSVGPRDNFNHTVISPYQVSGDGIWCSPTENMTNSTMVACGQQKTHLFYPAISPIYSLTSGDVAPTIHLFVKPIYKMLNAPAKGQPLENIMNVCVPNGLLLTQNPGYLDNYPGLFFPGKDDKGRNPRKIRVRVSFDLLDKISPWRVHDFG